MAAASLPTQRHEEFKEEFLTCSLCYESYGNGNRQAKCLPCLHTYCQNCLERHANNRSKFNCPKCRYLVILPGGTVDSLPNNFLVENLKEYQHIFSCAVSCGSCEDDSEDNEAVSFCHNCRCFLCQGCVDAHRKLGMLRAHDLSTIAELQEKKSISLIGQIKQCKKHPKQDLTLFCKNTDCRIPLCSTCGLIDHKTHDLVDLEAAIKDMQETSSKVASRKQNLVKELAATETKLKTLTDNFTEIESVMQDCIRELLREIEDHYNLAHSKLKQMYEAEMKSLQSNIESMKSLSDQMTSASEFIDHACDSNQGIQVLSSQPQILKRLDELAFLKPKVPSDKTDFDLTTKHYEALIQTKTLLENLYDVDWLVPEGKEIKVGNFALFENVEKVLNGDDDWQCIIL